VFDAPVRDTMPGKSILLTQRRRESTGRRRTDHGSRVRIAMAHPVVLTPPGFCRNRWGKMLTTCRTGADPCTLRTTTRYGGQIR